MLCAGCILWGGDVLPNGALRSDSIGIQHMGLVVLCLCIRAFNWSRIHGKQISGHDFVVVQPCCAAPAKMRSNERWPKDYGDITESPFVWDYVGGLQA